MHALAPKRVELPVGLNESEHESTKRSFADGDFVEVGPFQSVRVKLIQVFPVSLRDIYFFCEILMMSWQEVPGCNTPLIGEKIYLGQASKYWF